MKGKLFAPNNVTLNRNVTNWPVVSVRLERQRKHVKSLSASSRCMCRNFSLYLPKKQHCIDGSVIDLNRGQRKALDWGSHSNWENLLIVYNYRNGQFGTVSLMTLL